MESTGLSIKIYLNELTRGWINQVKCLMEHIPLISLTLIVITEIVCNASGYLIALTLVLGLPAVLNEVI